MLDQQMQKNSLLLFIVKVFFGLMFGLILFPSIIKSIIIILFFITIIYFVFKRGFVINKSFFIINSSIFFFFLLTLTYSSNLSEAFLKIQTTLSLLVFPLLFSMLKESDVIELFKNIKIYLFIFIGATFLYNTVPFLWFYITHYSLRDTIKHFPILIIEDIGKYSIHPIYMSMHCVLSIFFSIYIIKDIKSSVIKFLLILINVVLVVFLIIYSKKGPILALLFTLFIWSFFRESKIRKYYFFAIITSLILLITIPKSRNKFIELFNVELAKTENSNSTNIRYSIYKSSFSLIKEAPFSGFGIGDYNGKLISEYKKNAPFLLNKKYNSHNQYLSFILIGGIPLLIIFIYFLYFNISLSIKHQNYLLLIIISFYSMVMLTENIVERENGVIFFAFFVNFFALKNYSRNE